MPTFEIEAFEMWETKSTYIVDAEDEKTAIALIKEGEVECFQHDHPGYADEFVEVLDVR